MARKIETIIKRLDEVMAKRDKLDKEYFRESDKLTTQWEKLMKELNDA